MQVKLRKRKKISTSERKSLGHPGAANQVWSMDFVFDRTAGDLVIKSLTVADDDTHEAVAIVPERAIRGLALHEYWIIWLYSVGYLTLFVWIMARNSVGAPCCYELIYAVLPFF